MLIAVVGAGALGTIYAQRLASTGKVDVCFVVRDLARAPRRLKTQLAYPHSPEASFHDAPASYLEIPAEADVVMVTVRVDQLDDALLDRLAVGGPPHRCIVTLTPLLPGLLARAREKLGARLIVGMPGVAGYEPDSSREGDKAHERHVRYWTPRSSPTVIEARPPGDPHAPIALQLVALFHDAGLPVVTAKDAAGLNVATTLAFFPLLLALRTSGTIDALLADGPLLKLALEATKESRALAKGYGELAGFASLILSFAGPFTVRTGIKLARSRAPEAIVFLNRHFGDERDVQHLSMMREVNALAEARKKRLDALARLAARCGI